MKWQTKPNSINKCSRKNLCFAELKRILTMYKQNTLVKRSRASFRSRKKKSQSPTVEIITNLELFLVFCWTGAYPVSAILFSTVSGSTWTKTNMPSVVLRDDNCLYCVQITFPCLRFCVIWRWQDRVECEFWLDTYLKCISVLLRRIGGGCELP